MVANSYTTHMHHAHIMPSHGGEDNCHLLNRKKRRGLIEKRRRDRINNSLLELRRLVPSAFEKQGSAKLEKAEILQMTVDHLRMLHAKGFDTFSFDPHKFAVDYHSVGFRECTSEVARFLVSNEGLDLQDPFRLRIISHLQCFSAQRELTLKTSAGHTGWNPSAFTTTQYPPVSMPPPPSMQAIQQHQMQSSNSYSSEPLHGTAPVSSISSASSQYSSGINGISHSHSHSFDGHVHSTNGHTLQPMTTQSMSTTHSQTSIKSSGSPIPSANPVGSLTSLTPLSYPPSSTAPHHGHHHYFTGGYSASNQQTSGVNSTSQNLASLAKHYRPWGAENIYL